MGIVSIRELGNIFGYAMFFNENASSTTDCPLTFCHFKAQSRISGVENAVKIIILFKLANLLASRRHDNNFN